MKTIEILKNFMNKGKRKQIIFALFAFIISIILKNTEGVLLSAAPVVVAAGAAAAGGGGAAAGGAAASASAGSAAAGGSAVASGTAASGATSASGSAVTAGGSTATGGSTAGNVAKTTSKVKSTSVKTSTPKTPAQQGYKSPDSLQSPKMTAKSSNMVDDTTKASKKEASKSNVQKEKKASKKKDRLNAEQSNDEEENKTDLEEGSSGALNKNTLLGCIFLPILFLLFFPLFVVLLISPTTTTIKGFNCDQNPDSVLCSDEDNTNFWEKTKNLFRYGKFDTTDNVINKTLEETYTKFYDDYSVRIDIPLLLSSILVDAINYQDELVIEDESGNKYDVNKVLKDRFDYTEELANMQMITYEVAYVCVAKEIGDTVVYNRQDPITRMLDVEEKEQPRLDCNEDTVDTIVYDYYKVVDKEGYYDRLLENPEVLGKIYGEDLIETEQSLNTLIGKIKLQYNLFSIMYRNYDSDESAGNIPPELLTDINVDLQNPLKGTYYITSRYGYREGVFAGRHKGIDAVSSDTNIYAAGNGVVTGVYTERLGGNVIEITHTTTSGEKYVTQYAHLSMFLAKKGDVVKSGDVIGIMGNTGVTSGAHLHFQMWSVTTKKTYNPVDLFKEATNY